MEVPQSYRPAFMDVWTWAVSERQALMRTERPGNGGRKTYFLIYILLCLLIFPPSKSAI